MKLIDGWRQSWRLWSVRLSALGALLTGLALAAPDFLQSLWTGLPADLRALLPASVTHAVPMLIFGLTILARVVAQEVPKATSQASPAAAAPPASPAAASVTSSIISAEHAASSLLARINVLEGVITDLGHGLAEFRAAQAAATPVTGGGDATAAA